MTLIVGLRGIGKSYLAADSRATIKQTGETRDDATKWQAIGKQAVVVAAGDAQLAAYICDQIISGFKDPDTTSFNEVKMKFEQELKELAIKFNKDTNRFCHCTLMLAGYDKTQKEDVDAAVLGEIMSADIVANSGGRAVNQSIDPEIIKAMSTRLATAQLQNKPLGRGDRVTINRPKSELRAYYVDVSAGGVNIKQTAADTFDALIFGADTAVNKLELPKEIISNIYFRNMSGQTAKEIITGDGIYLIAFIKSAIDQRGYKEVGGNVIPLLITPDFNAVGSGQVAKLNLITKEVEIVGDIEVKDGRLHYKDIDGEYKPFLRFREFLGKSKGQLADY